MFFKTPVLHTFLDTYVKHALLNLYVYHALNVRLTWVFQNARFTHGAQFAVYAIYSEVPIDRRTFERTAENPKFSLFLYQHREESWHIF